MRKISSQSLGIEQGEVLLFSDFDNDGPMWAGEGARQVRQTVIFAEPFLEPPSVRVWLTMWDIAHTATSRVDIAAWDVQLDSFSIVFRTWGDTRVARVRAGWLALGPVRDEDHWEID
jgi:H-type lectin domain